jgi:hypothetical protein
MAVDPLGAFLKVLTVVCEWELTPQEHKPLSSDLQNYSCLLATMRRVSPPSSSARGGETGRLASPLAKDSAAPESRCAGPN